MAKQHKKFRQAKNPYDDISSGSWIELQELDGDMPKAATIAPDTPKAKTTALDIPYDAWSLILQHFDRAELAGFMRTCRTFKEVAQEEFFYLPIKKEVIRLNSEEVNVFIRLSISNIKEKITAPDWPEYNTSELPEKPWKPTDYLYLNIIPELITIHELFDLFFKNTFAEKPFVKVLGELRQYYKEFGPYFQRMHLKDKAQFFEFVDKKYKEIVSLLKREKKTRRISFFHRTQPTIISELYKLMQLVIEKSPVSHVWSCPCTLYPR
ncbi:MAG: hypothetical protein COV52_10385 [Gammaproteobacteria bacterium CG11_big_fil_rev_8_21_14_0_20_46_22]|nr:MAG: hypothetical protein COW05_09610 [Gammaproteobacteria bacterium CG12_big_fil_rev_8_21_14_0_65_46_12]PIR10103.1 MAG: hypothetical protein COV52_10385 [Gammaproteobacteria bacterium CG11_big_fil_rev_8_21_14_0_20_46_22]